MGTRTIAQQIAVRIDTLQVLDSGYYPTMRKILIDQVDVLKELPLGMEITEMELEELFS
jgi:hypothetical protein